MTVKIPEDIISGGSTMEYEVPWLVPGAILLLDELLTKDMKVLEFGSGGSTLFFGRRTKSVLSLEDNPEWFGKVSEAVKEKGLSNVELVFYKGLAPIPKDTFNCILIDCGGPSPEVKRKRLINKSIPLLVDPNILVIDNYGRMHPLYNVEAHRLLAEKYGPNWEKEVAKPFRLGGWFGRGTLVLHGIKKP